MRDDTKVMRALERIFWIDGEVRAGKYPNTGSIASRFEISRKTAQRDLDFMRVRLQLPLEYRARRRGWSYAAQLARLPGLAAYLAEAFSTNADGTQDLGEERP